ncbi:hypothetical protein LC593_30555 [Nostoc sp. CHAB 5844]|nr:hypothetical protein [Nostoc sp. CHAB 5844]
MFTRTELELLTLAQLKILCNRYGLRPTGSGAYKVGWEATAPNLGYILKTN